MGRFRKVTLVSLFTLAAAVSVAGFFSTDAMSERQAPGQRVEGVVAAPQGPVWDQEGRAARSVGCMKAAEASSGAVADLSFGSDGRAYRREAALSLKVGDVFETLKAVEKQVADAKGYLESIDVNGTASTHDGRIRLAVPSDRFTEVFGALRRLGDLLNERISAQMVPWNRQDARGPKGQGDEAVELVKIDLSLSDNPERVAKTRVGALMGAAWEKGMDHFARGGAVLLEGAGYVLPFVLSFGAILILVGAFGLVARLFRRASAVRIPYAVPAE